MTGGHADHSDIRSNTEGISKLFCMQEIGQIAQHSITSAAAAAAAADLVDR
jgi:hypothetical protein